MFRYLALLCSLSIGCSTFESDYSGTNFLCNADEPCPSGFNCVNGRCVDPFMADADPNAPDADPSAPDADPSSPDATPGSPDAMPGDVLLETLTIPAGGAQRVSNTVLLNGVTYRLRASGMATVGGSGDQMGDAEYHDFSNIPSSVQDLGGAGSVDLGIGVDDSTIGLNKSPNWGPFQPSHIYEIDFVGSGAPITAQYHDPNFGNNSGTLTLEIRTP